MTNIATGIETLIEPTVQAEGYELVGCEYIIDGRNSIVRVYIDSPKGVKIDDCAIISRRISALLDVEDPVAGRYQLEVSSPGIERPLFKPAHYQAQIDKNVKLRLQVPVDGSRNIIGKIVAADAEAVTLEIDGEATSFPFDNISKGKIKPTDEV